MQVLGPDIIAPVTKSGNNTLAMAATLTGQSVRITVGGQQYLTPSSGLSLNTGTSGFNGIDTGTFTAGTVYNIFAVVSSGVLGMVISSGSAPFGFTSYTFLGKLIAATGATISHVMNKGEQFVEYLHNTSTSTSVDDSTSFGHGILGSQIQDITVALTRRVRSLSPILSTDTLLFEVSSDRSRWTNLSSGMAVLGGTVSSIQYQGNYYGAGRLNIISSTDVDILFGQYRLAPAASYAGAGGAWSGGAGSGFWRLTKISGIITGP